MFQLAQSIFSKHGATRRLDVTKAQIRPRVRQLSDQIIFGKTSEQLLAEAKSEILRHEYRADLAENNICELKRQIDQIDSQAVEIRHTRTGYGQSRLLNEGLEDRERALRDTRIRSIQKLEEL